MEPYDHVVYLDRLMMAAENGRLYKSGIGPECVYVPDPTVDPNSRSYRTAGSWVHPETGEPAIFNIAASEPPRHGKSYHISEHMPAQFLSRYPDLRVQLASYESDFAAEWGGKARELIDAHPELGIEIDPSMKANKRWGIKGHRGEMKTAGAGGPLTGGGRHRGIIDDLLKNAEEALSDTVRRGNINWYITTWKTRREPHPARLRMIQIERGQKPTWPNIFCVDISISTRWHKGDLNGWLRENEEDSWFFVNLPAIAFDDEQSKDYGDPGRCVLGRTPGEALCPDRYNITQLEENRKSDEGLFWFNALYQGVPRVEAGGVISRPFHYFRVGQDSIGRVTYELDDGHQVPVDHCIRFATMDVAGTTKTRSDYTVFSVWDITPALKFHDDREPARRMLLRARYKLKLESADHMDHFERWADEWQPRYIGIENKTFGQTLIQNARRRSKHQVRELDPDTDKFSRALVFGYLVLGGKVYFPDDAPWLEDWEEEHIDFPHGTHDDQVDTSSYAALEYEKIPQRLHGETEAPVTNNERVKAHLRKVVREKTRARRVRQVKSRRYTHG
jgi:predicted phage terminase large subunit-like protein